MAIYGHRPPDPHRPVPRFRTSVPPPRQYILSPVQEGLLKAVERIRAEGRVPIGILAYDPRTDELTLLAFDDIQDIGEANAILSKFNCCVIEKDKK